VYTRDVIDFLLLLVIILTAIIVVTAVAHIWADVPFVPTPRKVGEEMLDFVELKGKEVVYDLGAGDARLLIAAKRRYPSITATGVEIVPTVWAYGRLRIWLSRQKVKLFLRSVLVQDVSDADCIFLYLIPGLMQKLEKKFDKELKPGTKVVSYAFPFPTKKPIKEKSVPWLKGKSKLFLYEW
tara:strand:- start:83 stop:628 length:546 start_codon:yes stop_codon:yes gene_type:complete